MRVLSFPYPGASHHCPNGSPLFCSSHVAGTEQSKGEEMSRNRILVHIGPTPFLSVLPPACPFSTQTFPHTSPSQPCSSDHSALAPANNSRSNCNSETSAICGNVSRMGFGRACLPPYVHFQELNYCSAAVKPS